MVSLLVCSQEIRGMACGRTESVSDVISGLTGREKETRWADRQTDRWGVRKLLPSRSWLDLVAGLGKKARQWN